MILSNSSLSSEVPGDGRFSRRFKGNAYIHLLPGMT